MISRKLSVCILEVIQEHANQHHNGALDMETILEAMGEITADLLSQMPSGQQDIYNRFCVGIACATNSKRSQQLLRVGLSN